MQSVFLGMDLPEPGAQGGRILEGIEHPGFSRFRGPCAGVGPVGPAGAGNDHDRCFGQALRRAEIACS